jgi:rfaE bifunctional protein kinase chain/domain/rfaE bifunctional protein nucleotidyltransferase chain/domain
MKNEEFSINQSRKIINRFELLELIGDFPRLRKVIMCHGTFDLVHPGHLRHLQYAKSQADILIVSVTADKHVSKSNYRPMIPQELRAFNLAAIEFVDYVIIDDEPTPIKNIDYIRPDFFAKGYDYVTGGIHPKTHDEVKSVTSYGGEIIFTPGDVVFSSSLFIENFPPNLGLEKLETLMRHKGITFESLRKSIKDLQNLKVIVVGDTIVDTYVSCSVQGTSTSKSPTISTRVESTTDYVGGAAAVANHLKAAGANVLFVSITGDDVLGEFVRNDLARRGIEHQILREKGRPTTNKKLYIAEQHRLLKVDVVDNRPISEKSINSIIEEIRRESRDIAIMSDFKHGIFNRVSIPEFISVIPNGTMKVADSQVASRWGNILDFKGFDLITPNEKEARFALADQDSVVRSLCTELYRNANCKNLILKMGAKGIMFQYSEPEIEGSYFQIDSLADQVLDPVGAGDALLAYASLGLKASGDPVISGILGVVAAGIACSQQGNVPIQPTQIIEKLNSIEEKLTYK